jgi:hypothetical protein
MLVGGYAAVSAGLLLTPPRLAAVGQAEGATAVLQVAGSLAIVVGLVGGAGALALRLRRSRGEERQQLRWIGAAAALLAVTTVALVVNNVARGGQRLADWPLASLFYLGYLSVPVATGIAVLRYRLYDIDVIISRAVRLAALGVFVTAGYVIGVVAIGAVLGGSDAVWPSLVAYVLVALAFQPARRRVDRFADRVVYGDRAAPYDSLAQLSRQLGAGGLTEPQLLQLVARSTAQAIGAVAARATVALPDGGEVSQTWPAQIRMTAQLLIPIGRHDEELGRIELALPPGHALDRARTRLMAELAAHADLAFRNLRLTAALRARAATLAVQRTQLAASRRRLLDAADTERRQVAAEIRSQVAVHLDPLPAALAEVRTRMATDPDGARRDLEEMHQATTVAIDAMRRTTAGVLPPLLARRGLVSALQSLADRSGRGATVLDGRAADRRFAPSVEAAAYAWCVAVLAHISGGARVRLEVHGSPDVEGGEWLLVEVTGPSSGVAGDLQLAVDRIEALGGQVRVPGDPGSGGPDGGDGRDSVTRRAVLPLHPSPHTSARS